MISRSLVGSFVLSVAVTMCVDITAAQVRGTGGGARGGHGGGVIRSGQRARLTRAEHRRSYGGFLFYPGFDYYDDDYESNYEPPEASRNVVREPATNVTAATATKPAQSLVLEKRGGQWVRMSSGSQLPVAPANVEPQSSSSTGAKGTPAPPDQLPPAVLVFRDGHEEQVARYVVRGNVLYTNSDYGSTGTWTREIPIAQLDVPASVKRSAERGGVFSLPTRPNEVVVRF